MVIVRVYRSTLCSIIHLFNVDQKECLFLSVIGMSRNKLNRFHMVFYLKDYQEDVVEFVQGAKLIFVTKVK